MDEILIDCMDTDDSSLPPVQRTTSTPHSTSTVNFKSSPAGVFSESASHRLTGNGKHVTSYEATNERWKSSDGSKAVVHQSVTSSWREHDVTDISARCDVIHTNQSPDGGHKDRSGSVSEGGTDQNVIMMYSPDIPSATRRGYRGSVSNLGGYYTLIETEESVKCVVSTVLFVTILVAMLLVALLKNPQM